MKKVPNDFEWVDARAACSPIKVFEQLKSQVAHDVEVRNKMAGHGPKFDTHFETNAIAVFLNSTAFHRDVPYRIIRFFLDGARIIARFGDETEIFSATLTLNDEGECRLRIGEEDYALWQVRHMALEKLFFEIIRPAS
jgi:hypothetical protein